MIDRVSPETRSAIMRSVGTKNTGPELCVRKLLHKLGYRYRLHRHDLPGRPDIVFPGRRKVVFVHGCFWHGHKCSHGRLPRSRTEYWEPKIESNRHRDKECMRRLRASGWSTLVVWQCELKDMSRLRAKLIEFLGAPKAQLTGNERTGDDRD